MIAITGATGELGSRVVDLLDAAGVDVRLVVRSTRSPARAGHDLRVGGDYGDRSAMTEALRGCDTLFLVSAREAPDRVAAHLSAVASAADAGVKQVVYTSFQGAAPDCTFTFGRDHWHTEQAIRGSGMDFVFLRDSFYLAGLAGMVGSDGVIRGPAGTGAVAAVSHDDVAAVAAAALRGDVTWGETLDVTGPASLTLAEAATIMSEHTGRSIGYVCETEDEAYASRAGYGAPTFEVAGWVSSYQAIANGEVGAVSDAVPTVTGRPAESLADFLRRHPNALGHVTG